MPQNSLTLCVDDTGVYYRVPICVINEPIGYDADFQLQKLKNKKAPKETELSLKFRSKHGDLAVKPTNQLPIGEFKQMFLDKCGEKTEGLTTDNIRLFAMGKELKNDLFLYSYDLITESTV